MASLVSRKETLDVTSLNHSPFRNESVINIEKSMIEFGISNGLTYQEFCRSSTSEDAKTCQHFDQREPGRSRQIGLC